MTVDLLTRYDQLRTLHQKSCERVASLKRSLAEAQGQQERHWRELKKVRAELGQALSGDTSKSSGETPEVPSQAPAPEAHAKPPTPETKPVPATPGLRPSIRQTVRAIPRDSDIGTAEVREALGLSEGATYTRIQKAKRAGLVESAGWGRYKLTEEGKKLHGPVLQAVPASVAE